MKCSSKPSTKMKPVMKPVEMDAVAEAWVKLATALKRSSTRKASSPKLKKERKSK